MSKVKHTYPNESNLKKIKEATKLLYDVVPINPQSILINHPMINSITNVIPKEFMLSKKDDILKGKYNYYYNVNGYKFTEEDFSNLQEFGLNGLDTSGDKGQLILNVMYKLDELLLALYFHDLIDKTKDIVGMYIYVRSPYKLLWFSLVKDYLSEEDFAHYIEDCWISEENPNQDVNVSRKQSLSWFKMANKKLLMNEEDYKHWEELPKQVHIYRGVSIGHEEYGLSWTDDIDKAEWFMNRFNKKDKDGNVTQTGYLLEAVVPKDMIVAYFNTRSEAECLLDVFKAKRMGLIKVMYN